VSISAITKKDSKESRKAKKSFKRKLSSKERKARKIIRTHKEKELIAYNRLLHYSKDIESFCKLNNLSKWAIEGNLVVRINEDVSLFDNPEKVLRILLRILHSARHKNVYPKIEFETRVSFGALYLIDNICWEISQKRNWGIHLSKMNENDKRILSKLRTFYSSEYDDEKAYMVNEKVIINRKDNVLANQQYKAKSKIITDMIQRAIRENNNPSFILNPIAYQAITSTIGEHFDNILQHVPDAEHGYLCGFYDKELKEVIILIFNFGTSIAGTLKVDRLPVEIRDEIQKVIESHKKKKYLLINNGFTETNALTLLALQEGISSRLEFDKSRGHGIIDFIEHCFELNENCKISMISGDTAIKIDKKYKISEEFFLDRKRRVLAFNDNNNLYEKPDKDYVCNLPLTFPGVIIETRIPLEII
jgi:hypothetical protein